MKKIILYAIVLLASMHESRTMFWHHKDKHTRGVDKIVAMQAISTAAQQIFEKPPASVFDNHYDNWVIDDIIERTDSFIENDNITAISKSLFEFFIAEIGKIAHKRGVYLENPRVTLEKHSLNKIGKFDSMPVYSPTAFKKSKSHFYEKYQAKVARDKKRVVAQVNADDASETFVDDPTNNRNSPHQSRDAGTNSADESSSADGNEHRTAIDQSCEDDQTGQIIAAVQHAGELDQNDQLQKHSFIQTLLNNRLAVSGGIAVIAFILYKYKNRIQEFLFPSDTMQVVEAPAPTQTDPIPNEEIAQTLEQLKQMLAKKGK